MSDNRIIDLFAKKGSGKPKKCGAKRKHGRGACAQWAVKGRDRCRMHGGTQPVGIDSPNFKHGMRVRKRNLPSLLNQLDALDRERMDEYKTLSPKGAERVEVKALAYALVWKFAEKMPAMFPAMLSAYGGFLRSDKEVHEGIVSHHTLDISLEEWRKNGPRSISAGPSAS